MKDVQHHDVSQRAMSLLHDQCLACHNTEKKKGGLTMESRQSLLQGGENGQVVLAGRPDASPLLKALEPSLIKEAEDVVASAQIKTPSDAVKSLQPEDIAVLRGIFNPPRCWRIRGFHQSGATK